MKAKTGLWMGLITHHHVPGGVIGQTSRPLTWRDRTFIVFLASKVRRWKEALTIVQPDTVVRWHRDRFRRYWRRKSRSRAQYGRPPLSEDVVALIKRIAMENATWGAERIRGRTEQGWRWGSKSCGQGYVGGSRGRRLLPSWKGDVLLPSL